MADRSQRTQSLRWLWLAAGVFSFGFLLFTLMVKVATPIMLGELRLDRSAPSRVAPVPAS